MEKNVGNADRYVRIALGVILAAVGLASLGNLLLLDTIFAVILVLIGVVLFGTGLTQRCLLYRPFGINTGK